ncbi:hypothetical protein AYO44_12770 [Planctomycetaceae bacterium SCGC AG-212-F19]|nr:hypothetical protein AYO44_12770 [Planctomycetaceae bacterium SCGC AG-212-F19]
MSETSPNPETNPLLDLFRDMTPGQKFLLVGHVNSEVRRFHADYFRRRHPDATNDDIVEDWMAFTLDPALLQEVREYKARQQTQS